jgi:hypothetical protein
MLGIPIEKVGKFRRQQGKGGDLACGFGGSIGAWRRIMGKDVRPDIEIKADIDKWRAAHPVTRQFWKRLMWAVYHAFRYGVPANAQMTLACPKIIANFDGYALTLTLPIVNCFGMAVTSNHRDAFYLTPDDRRYYIATSECPTGTFDVAYWNSFWHWYKHENGINDIVALLRERDLSRFDPKAPPPKDPRLLVHGERGPQRGPRGDQ